MSGVEAPGERGPSVRAATAADLPAVKRLLQVSGLPLDGIPDGLEHFWIAEAEGRVGGVAGLELYGVAALLRSVAVDAAWRSAGLGRKLTEHVLREAGKAGIEEVFLLTTTADRYFPRFSFDVVARDAVPDSVKASAEFQGACPASAVIMHRSLHGEGGPAGAFEQ